MESNPLICLSPTSSKATRGRGNDELRQAVAQSFTKKRHRDSRQQPASSNASLGISVPSTAAKRHWEVRISPPFKREVTLHVWGKTVIKSVLPFGL